MVIAIAVLGATGRMGKRILQLTAEDPDLQIACALTRPSFSDLLIALANADVAIDFTSSAATKMHLDAAVQAGKPLVLGTTGHSPEQLKEIEDASRVIPILHSANFSFGIALCMDAVARLGAALSSDGAIRIVETHHAHKKDSPSGTALALAKAASCKESSDVPIQSIRIGEVIGEHVVTFECGHEQIELKHTCHSRDTFAKGALLAAKFLCRQSPGLYSAKDLFKSFANEPSSGAEIS